MKPVGEAIAVGKLCIVADLHLGLVRFHDGALLEKLAELADRFDTIVVAGDVRHLGRPFPIEKLFRAVSCELVLVRGNHDAGIDAEKVFLHGKYAIFHGHTLPKEAMEAKHWIIGHAHPSVYISDGIGGFKERVFMRGEVNAGGERKRVTVLPAFNDLCASTAVNLERPAGVIFRRWNYSDWDVVLLDGTVLSLRDL